MSKNIKKSKRNNMINPVIQVQPLTKENNQIKLNFNVNQSISNQLFPNISIQQSEIQIQAMAMYHEYLRLFEINQQLNEQIERQVLERNDCAAKYRSYKASENDEIIKRKRRQANEIKRLYYCPINKCRKQYGSQGSLTHHVRLKHLQFYTSGKFQLFIDNYIKQMRNNKEIGKQDEEKNISEVKKVYIKNNRIDNNDK